MTPATVSSSSARASRMRSDVGSGIRATVSPSQSRRDREPRREETQMDYEVRTCSSAAELREAVRPIWHYFGRSGLLDDQFERLAHVLPPERMTAAWEDGHAVGGAGAFPFVLTVPGGRVRASAVPADGVLPTHGRH